MTIIDLKPLCQCNPRPCWLPAGCCTDPEPCPVKCVFQPTCPPPENPDQWWVEIVWDGAADSIAIHFNTISHSTTYWTSQTCTLQCGEWGELLFPDGTKNYFQAAKNQNGNMELRFYEPCGNIDYSIECKSGAHGEQNWGVRVCSDNYGQLCCDADANCNCPQCEFIANFDATGATVTVSVKGVQCCTQHVNNYTWTQSCLSRTDGNRRLYFQVGYNNVYKKNYLEVQYEDNSICTSYEQQSGSNTKQWYTSPARDIGIWHFINHDGSERAHQSSLGCYKCVN